MKKKTYIPYILISIVILLMICTFSACGNNSGNGRALLPETIGVGDVITFGSTEQDNVNDDGTELIEWVVLDIKESCALLLSKQIISSYEYNLNTERVTWEDSTLRAWLNSTFYESAFSADERNLIVSATNFSESVHQKYLNTVTDSYEYTAEPLSSCTTEEKIFILSTGELDSYFPTEEDRIAEPTAYVKLNSSDAFSWWTRTAGVVVGTQRMVDNEGSHALGGAANDIAMGIRPAMWVDCSNVTIRNNNEHTIDSTVLDATEPTAHPEEELVKEPQTPLEMAIAYAKSGEYKKANETYNFAAILTGNCYGAGAAAIYPDGTVHTADWANNGAWDVVESWSDIEEISCGDFHLLGLKNDGTVFAAGKNEHGECNVGNWTNIAQIAAGSYHSVGIKMMAL